MQDDQTFFDTIENFLKAPFRYIGPKNTRNLILGVLTCNLLTIIYFHSSEQFSQIPKPSLWSLFGVFPFIILWKILIFIGAIFPARGFKVANIQVTSGLFLLFIVPFLLFRNETFWPKYIGGDGRIDMVYDGFPHVPEIPYSQSFFMAMLAMRLVNIGNQVAEKDQMSLFFTYFSIVLYMTNNIRVCILLMFITNLAQFLTFLESTLCYFFAKRWKRFPVISYGVNWAFQTMLKGIPLGQVFNAYFKRGPNCQDSWALKIEMMTIELGLLVLFLSSFLELKILAFNITMRIVTSKASLNRNTQQEENQDQDKINQVICGPEDLLWGNRQRNV